MSTVPTNDGSGNGRRTMPKNEYGWFHNALLGLLTPFEVAVYCVLAMHVDHQTQECWPHQKTIARLARCSVPQVRRALDQLAKLGLVAITPTLKGNRYTLLPVANLSARPLQTETLSQSGGAICQSDPERSIRAVPAIYQSAVKEPDSVNQTQGNPTQENQTAQTRTALAQSAIPHSAPPPVHTPSTVNHSLPSQKPQPIEDEQDRAAREYDRYLRSIEYAKYDRLNTRPF